MLTQEGWRQWLFHSDKKGQKRWTRASPKESRHRRWGLTPHKGLTLRVARRPCHSTGLLCCEALGKGLKEVPGPGSRVAQHWVREGNVALDSYCRAIGKAQPDGRERRPGCSQKHWRSSAQAQQRITRGTWLGRGPSLGLPLSWLPGTAKPAIQAQLGLLMSSVPSTTHWITDSGRIKTSVPSYDFHL